MKVKLAGLSFGVGIGFVMSWARLSDPAVIRNMLLLREIDVFLLMGSAVFVAAIGAHVLRASGVRAIATGEPVTWAVEKPQGRHVIGSLLFGAGWCVTGTCRGPVAAMMGEGRLEGPVVAAGLLGGVLLQRALVGRRAASRIVGADEVPGAAGL